MSSRVVSAVQKRVGPLGDDPLYWLEEGAPGRHVLVALLLFGLFLIQNALGDPVNPWFSLLVLGHIVYLLILHRVSRIARDYRTSRWRVIRTQSHLLIVTLIAACSGTPTVMYLLYLPWVMAAAVYLSPPGGLLVGLEAALLGSVALWAGHLVAPQGVPGEVALLAISLLGAYLLTVYVWRVLTSQWRSRVQEIKAIQDVGSAIAGAVGVEQTYDAIFDLTSKLITYETSLILVWNPDCDRLEVEANRGYDPGFLQREGFTFRLGEGLSGHVACTGDPLLVPDAERGGPVQPLYRDITDGKPMRCFIGVPLVLGGDLIGVFELTSDQAGAFTQRDLQVLDALSDHIAIAVRNGQLQRRLEQEMRETELRYKELTDLYDFSVEMALESEDAEGLVNQILERAIERVDARSAAVVLSYRQQSRPRIVYAQGMDGSTDAARDLAQAVIDATGVTQNSITVNDIDDWRYGKPVFKEVVLALLAVPLRWQGETLGVLLVGDDKPGRHFDEEEGRLIERFANQVALAIGNSRLNEYRRSLIEISPYAIIRADRDGRIIDFNEESERILGVAADEASGRHAYNYYYDGLEEARRINRALMQAGPEGIRDEVTYVVGPHGEKIPISLSGMALWDEAGEREGSFAIMMDLRPKLALSESQTRNAFLVELERHPQDKPIRGLNDLRNWLAGQMTVVSEFCRTQYLILFGSMSEDDTVLSAVAWTDLPGQIEDDLPHYNWRKAGLQGVREGDRDHLLALEDDLIGRPLLEGQRRHSLISGIRGPNAEFFGTAACVVPVRLADNYRSVLVFGPWANTIEAQRDEEFLRNVSRIICTRALGWLQALHLRAKQREAKLAEELVIHRSRMTLHQIDGKLGLIKRRVSADSDALEAANEGERLVSLLARAVTKAFKSNVVEVEPQDYRYQRLPLAALVQNCVAGFESRARQKRRQLCMDSSVELLPYADVDPTFFSVALSNIVDNALKYSYENTSIRLRSEYDTKTATIFVEDIGDKLSEKAQANLQKPGLRWTTGSRHIPGMGLGLWEANSIARNHGGKLGFTSVRERKYGPRAHHVRVWITIALVQNKRLHR